MCLGVKKSLSNANNVVDPHELPVSILDDIGQHLCFTIRALIHEDATITRKQSTIDHDISDDG